MRRSWGFVLVVLPVAVLLTVDGMRAAPRAQSRELQFDAGTISKTDFIPRTLRAQLGEIPRLGWYISGGRFVATEHLQSLSLLAAAGNPVSATLIADLTNEQRVALQAREHVGCWLENTDHLSVYRVDGKSGKGMALYTTKAFPGGVRSGLYVPTLGQETIDNTVRALGWTGPARLQRHAAIATGPGTYFYTYHSRYDAVSRVLRQTALVLHDSTGRVVAHDNQKFTFDNVADAADWPTLDDKNSLTEYVRNVFELPGFPYPVIFDEGDSSEGRNVILTTFSANGKFADMDWYEYTVDCLLRDRSAPGGQGAPTAMTTHRVLLASPTRRAPS